MITVTSYTSIYLNWRPLVSLAPCHGGLGPLCPFVWPLLSARPLPHWLRPPLVITRSVSVSRLTSGAVGLGQPRVASPMLASLAAVLALHRGVRRSRSWLGSCGRSGSGGLRGLCLSLSSRCGWI